MKKNLVTHSFAVATAALMMLSAAACSTAPSQNDATVVDQPAHSDSDLSASNDPTGGSAPSMDAPVVDSAPIADSPTSSGSSSGMSSAPSSLGASSSGRGH